MSGQDESVQFATVQVERSYDMRTAAILHFNTARKDGKDLDDALDAAWRAMLSKSASPEQNDHDALRADNERLASKIAVTMGVGSGDGQLFVHGDHASIKAAQAIILERDQLRAELAALRQPVAEREAFCDGNCTWLDHHPSCTVLSAPAPAPGPDVSALVEALKSLLGQLPSVSCDSFHHPRKDQHGAHDECPVFERYLSALMGAKVALAARKAGGVQ